MEESLGIAIETYHELGILSDNEYISDVDKEEELPPMIFGDNLIQSWSSDDDSES